jgi:hypothetical protein
MGDMADVRGVHYGENGVELGCLDVLQNDGLSSPFKIAQPGRRMDLDQRLVYAVLRSFGLNVD